MCDSVVSERWSYALMISLTAKDDAGSDRFHITAVYCTSYIHAQVKSSLNSTSTVVK
jgi:hypothetical protein